LTTHPFILLADLTVLFHASFVLFIVVGQLLITLGWWQSWRWSQNLLFRILHLSAISYVVIETWLGIPCPLTLLESKLRILGGQTATDLGFIAYWMHRILFYTAPDWVFTLLYSLFGGWVVLTFWYYPPQRKSPL